MANIKSAKKRIKTTLRNTLRNKGVKSEIKTLKHKTEKAIAENKPEKDSMIQIFIKAVDSAVSKGAFHRNKAARLKSRIIAKAKVKK